VFDATRWSKQYYSYTQAEFPEVDASIYTPAWLQFGQQTGNSVPGGDIIGHIVVSYTIELIDPIPARLQTTGNPTAKQFRKSYRAPVGPVKPTTEAMLLEAFKSLLTLQGKSGPSEVVEEEDEAPEAEPVTPAKGSASI